MAKEAVARARVSGREAMVEAVMASQILVRTRGEPGLWRVRKWDARVFWDDDSILEGDCWCWT